MDEEWRREGPRGLGLFSDKENNLKCVTKREGWGAVSSWVLLGEFLLGLEINGLSQWAWSVNPCCMSTNY